MGMTYLEKQNRMLMRLEETGYEMFDGDRDEALEFMASQFSRFPNYVNIVVTQQNMMPIWRVQYEGGEIYRDRAQGMDERRKMAHDSAISAVNILNRMSVNLNLPPFTDVDTQDRRAVADFAGAYCIQVFSHGTGADAADEKGAMGRAAGMDDHYDVRKVAGMMRLDESLAPHTDGTEDYGPAF